MGASSGAAKPLANLFGAEQEGRRGPTLGSVLWRDVEGSSWRLALVAPLRVQMFDGRTAQAIPPDDMQGGAGNHSHAPYTAFCVAEDTGPEGAQALPQLAIGCQDGAVLVFGLGKGVITGPVYELKVDGDAPGTALGTETEGTDAPASGASSSNRCPAMSVTALRISNSHELYAGACGRCRLWDLRSGELRREFHLPGGADRPVTPGALSVIRNDEAEGAQLWVGLDNGSIGVFDVQSGVLARCFSCTGSEAVVELTYFRVDGLVFALSAHRRVSVWDARTYSFLQKYPAELITCGADLSAMRALDLPSQSSARSSPTAAVGAAASSSTSPRMSLLLLAGVDGSLCIRRVGRRLDGKLNCVLLCYLEGVSGNPGCPITSVDYHAPTDSVLLGDAGCTVSLLSPLSDQLANSHAEYVPRLRSESAAAASPAAKSAQAAQEAAVPQTSSATLAGATSAQPLTGASQNGDLETGTGQGIAANGTAPASATAAFVPEERREPCGESPSSEEGNTMPVPVFGG